LEFHSSDAIRCFVKDLYDKIFGSGVGYSRAYDNAKSTYKAPFVTLFQSSGYGKSRLIQELKSLWMEMGIVCDVVYESFASSDAWPESTPAATQLMSRFGGSTSTDEAQISVFDYLSQLVKKFDSRCLVVIDEVRRLSTLEFGVNAESRKSGYQILRSAMRDIQALPGKKDIFFVLMDTMSVLSDIAPSKASDPSAKDIPLDVKLFHPFIYFHSFDSRLSEGDGDEKSYHSKRELVSMGRPMWSAFFEFMQGEPPQALQRKSGDNESKSHSVAWDKVVQFASKKLLCSDLLSPGTSITLEQALAILSCRCGLFLSPTSVVARRMVASHMATCLHVSLDREKLIVTYPSEPVLGAACQSLLRDSDVRTRCLQFLTEIFKCGAVERGNRGEVIGRLLCLFAMDSLTNYTVKDFFIELGFSSEEARLLCCENNNIESAHLHFTHFVCNQDSVVDEYLLKKCFRRQAALAFEMNRAGADLILPFRYWKEDKFVYRGVLVQLKNRKADKLSSLMCSDEVLYKLRPEFVFAQDEIPEDGSREYPSILLSVGSDSSEDAKGVQSIVKMQLRKRSSNQGLQQWHVGIILGYSTMRFLSDDVRKELRELAASKLRLESELVEKMVPLVYRNSSH
jgi:hypothetical protein